MKAVRRLTTKQVIVNSRAGHQPKGRRIMVLLYKDESAASSQMVKKQ